MALCTAPGEQLLPLLKADCAGAVIFLQTAAKHGIVPASPAPPAIGQLHLKPGQRAEILPEFPPSGVAGQSLMEGSVNDPGHTGTLGNSMSEIKHQKMRIFISRCVVFKGSFTGKLQL